MIIGDRYEILEKIGTGGMSDVYKAKCHKLNRYVAIKVLKQEFMVADQSNQVAFFVSFGKLPCGSTGCSGSDASEYRKCL